MSKQKLTLILGSGFSKDAGLPTTSDIPDKFLVTPTKTVLTHELEEEITKILRKFWEKVFGYKDGGLTTFIGRPFYNVGFGCQFRASPW